jgi:hypothetical protein
VGSGIDVQDDLDGYIFGGILQRKDICIAGRGEGLLSESEKSDIGVGAYTSVEV